MLNDALKSLADHCEAVPNRWLELASQLELTDIHITPKREFYELGVRRGGLLGTSATLNSQTGKKLIQRLKSAAKMNIAESRNPQDGRIQCDQMDARLATHPSLHGEGVSIRLFTFKQTFNLDQLGLEPGNLQAVFNLIEKPQGLTLVSGPTGSGKTTLVHAALKHLGHKAGRIATLEDPVEIVNESALQTDLSRLPDLTFAKGLRSLMRQDPDTLLVGEVRDIETASLCLHAALTGHRVFATVHAPSTTGTLFRMQELGVPLASLLNALNGIINLRLQLNSASQNLELASHVICLTHLPKPDLLDCTDLSQLDRLIRTHEGHQ